jgi:hypothetical protein
MPEYSEVEQEQVRRAHERYMLPNAEQPDPLVTDDEKKLRSALKQREEALNEFNPNVPDERSPLHEVKDDHEARVEDAGQDHKLVTNAELQLREPYTDEHMSVVATQNRAGVDKQPEDTQGVEDLEQEALVREAREKGKLYETGGPMGNYTGRDSLSPYVDGAWLAEASKQTGEKFF